MKLPPLRFALAALLAGAPVWADDSISVEVGKTVVVDVGHAKGLNCDDLSVARVEIRSATAKTNQLVITGLKPGRTYCRAGMPVPGPTVLVNIEVVPKND